MLPDILFMVEGDSYCRNGIESVACRSTPLRARELQEVYYVSGLDPATPEFSPGTID